MPDDRGSLDFTQDQSPADELRSKDLSLQRTRPPTEVPGYTAQKFLGAGAYGEVWSAQDKNTGRLVAIKFYAHRRGVDWSLLSKEVEKLVFLSTDRYVVQLLEVGWDADPPYYVMEYVENGSLEDLLHREGTFSVAEAIEMFREIAIGLVHSHGRGVLHCDLKPANILLDVDGKPRLADFGQSRLSNEQRPALGTLFFMAPEQADLNAVPDSRWDVYALGTIFYSLLLGHPPHRDDASVSRIETAEDLEDRLARYRQLIQSAAVPTEHRRVRGMDGRLADILERCLAPNPADRYANVQEVLDALTERERARTRQKMMALGLIGPLLVLLIAGFFAWRGYQSAVSDSEANYGHWAAENNQFAARLAAEKVTSEIGKYFVTVREEASQTELFVNLLPVLESPSLKKLMGEIQQPDLPEAKRSALQRQFMEDPDQRTLNFYLQNRLNLYLKAAQADPYAPKFSSVFILDRRGNQLAVAFDDESTSTSIGTNVSHRTYFSGRAADSAESRGPAATDGEIPHIQGTQLSAIFKSSSQKKWKVAISTPLYRGEGKEEFAGVLVYTIGVGDFAFFRADEEGTQKRFAVLVDGRPGSSQGTILQHKLFSEITKKGGKLPEELLSMRVPEETLTADGGQMYTDPLGKHPLGKEYDKQWIAAIQSVRAPSLPGVQRSGNSDDTGLDVLVQSDYEEVVTPVRDLSQRLLRNIVLMLAVVIITGIGVWALALRLYREPKRTRSPLASREGTPLHRMSTVQAGRDSPQL